MPKNKAKETRIMKVTLYAEDFERFDKGITHSDKGIRTKKGHLSALPDIEPVTEKDLPYREVVKAETVYVEAEKTHNGGLGTIVGEAFANAFIEILSDPEVQAGIAQLGKAFWCAKVKPRINRTVEWLKSDKKFGIKAAKLVDVPKKVDNTMYQVEAVSPNGRITVSGEQAAALVEAMREESRRLSAIIFLLSNILVKDEKTQDEYLIEQACIKQLVSEEASTTMKALIANQGLLEEGTAICFSDFLNGYIRHGNQHIAIPVGTQQNQQHEIM